MFVGGGGDGVFVDSPLGLNAGGGRAGGGRGGAGRAGGGLGGPGRDGTAAVVPSSPSTSAIELTDDFDDDMERGSSGRGGILRSLPSGSEVRR